MQAQAAIEAASPCCAPIKIECYYILAVRDDYVSTRLQLRNHSTRLKHRYIYTHVTRGQRKYIQISGKAIY